MGHENIVQRRRSPDDLLCDRPTFCFVTMEQLRASVTFENQGGSILSQPVTVTPNDDQMTLGNANGRIELRRTY